MIERQQEVFNKITEIYNILCENPQISPSDNKVTVGHISEILYANLVAWNDTVASQSYLMIIAQYFKKIEKILLKYNV